MTNDFNNDFMNSFFNSLNNKSNNDLDVGARELFKVYQSFLSAGFNENQSIELLKGFFTSVINK